jgi:hypothetical protein
MNVRLPYDSVADIHANVDAIATSVHPERAR